MDCVGDNYCTGVSFDESITPVAVEDWANVESIIAMEVPGLPCCWFCVDEDMAPWGSQRGGIEIKRSCKVLPGGDRWLSLRLAEEVYC